MNSLGVPELLRGEVAPIAEWVSGVGRRGWGFALLLIAAGAGAYGAAMGWWRAPVQAAFVAAKFPLVILLTTLGTALLNGMLAPLMGLGVSFRESLRAVLLSFAIASLVLGSLSPIALFLTWNVPALGQGGRVDFAAHAALKLFHVAAIAFAGITAHLALWQLLLRRSGNPAVAGRVLGAWLGANLFLGSQFVWILRPFIGSPVLPVEFLRTDAFRGNFYETVFADILQLLR